MPNFDQNSEDFELELVNESDLLDMQLEIYEGLLETPDDSIDSVDDSSLPEDNTVGEIRTQAVESQSMAEAAIAQGDYEAAAYHKENAEEASDAIGDPSVLEGASSLELQVADERQDRAMELESQQSEMAKSGDYAAAKELADEAAYEMRASDQLAGGSDHSGQAELESANMEWADWHQQISDDMLSTAADYANDGNLNAASNHLQGAFDHQSSADHYGDLGEHGGPLAATDPSAQIESHHYDTYSPTTVSSSIESSSTSTSVSSSTSTDIGGADDPST